MAEWLRIDAIVALHMLGAALKRCAPTEQSGIPAKRDEGALTPEDTAMIAHLDKLYSQRTGDTA